MGGLRSGPQIRRDPFSLVKTELQYLWPWRNIEALIEKV